MSNWILDAVLENIKAKIQAKEEFIKMCDLERSNFEDWLNTSDTYQAKNNEYWRVAKVMTEIQIKEYQEQLKEINEMLQEDSREYNILYDEIKDDIPYVGVI